VLVAGRCITDELDDNFLLFVDPVMKAMYRVDLTLSGSGPQQVHGIDIRTTNSPDRIAFDTTSRHFYWHDNDYGGLNSVKRMSLSSGVDEHTITVLSHGNNASKCCVKYYILHNILSLGGAVLQPVRPSVRHVPLIIFSEVGLSK